MTFRTLRVLRAALLSVSVAAALGGCPSHGPGTPPPDTAPATPRAPFALAVVPAGAARPATSGAVAFVDIAATQASRERGLMGRDRLEPDHGMLFVYRAPTPRRFWMKDCTIGLDIAFIREDGTISALATLPPGAGLPDDRIAVTESNGPVLYVLEMETGWFGKRGIVVGSVVDVSAAAAGVAAE